MMRNLAAVAWFVLVGVVGCKPCDRSGCEAFNEPSSSRIQGIAGVVAIQSDVVGNGCNECWFWKTELLVWSVPGAINDVNDAWKVISTPEKLRVHADVRYEQALEVGNYLVCQDMSHGNTACASVPVEMGQTTTVNVKVIEGPVRLAVYLPGESVANSESVLELLMPGPSDSSGDTASAVEF